MNVLGDGTVFLNIIVILLLVQAILKYRNRNLFDIQFLILVGAILCLLPVITFENILYIDVTYNWYSLSYSTVFMRILFGLGIIAYFVYNLHLLTIEDMPTTPVALIAIITGFGIGTMGVSAQVDPTAMAPIYYNPTIGGSFFIFSLMTFNIVGVFGFIYSLVFNPYTSIKNKISILDSFGIAFFFLSPIVIYLARLTNTFPIPVNGIFLITELSFCFHLLSYILSSSGFGYPMHPQLISLSIIEMKKNVVVAGYTLKKDVDFNKLQGMTILAVDSIIKDVFQSSNRDDQSRYTLDYGDTILLRNRNYLLVGMFRGNGKKIGRIVLNRLLNVFVKKKVDDKEINFLDILNKYLAPYLKKRAEIKDHNIYK